MAEHICNLNRKPYWDKNGFLRRRNKCCGKRDTKGGCTLTAQPLGDQLYDRNEEPINRSSRKRTRRVSEAA